MRATAILIICALLGAIAYFAYRERQHANAKEAQSEAERVVRLLPEGAQDAWLAYVDRRVAAAIENKAGAVSLRAPDSEATFVSRNTPFKVTCDPILGGRVDFGYGDNAVSLWIYGGYDSTAEKEPSLGVSKYSVAAASLSLALCERITQSIVRTLQP